MAGHEHFGETHGFKLAMVRQLQGPVDGMSTGEARQGLCGPSTYRFLEIRIFGDKLGTMIKSLKCCQKWRFEHGIDDSLVEFCYFVNAWGRGPSEYVRTVCEWILEIELSDVAHSHSAFVFSWQCVMLAASEVISVSAPVNDTYCLLN